MQPAPEPDLLATYGVLETPSEAVFDELAGLAASLCDAPMAVVSLADRGRFWFKARHGVEASEAAREHWFCDRAILQQGLFAVADASRDDWFSRHAFVTGPPQVRFYAGVPLLTPAGRPLGMLGVMDDLPRELHPSHAAVLPVLGRQVMAQLELRRLERAAAGAAGSAELHLELDSLYRTAPIGLALIDCACRYVRINERLAAINGRPVAEHIGRPVHEVIPALSPAVTEIVRQVCESRTPMIDQAIRGVTPAQPDVEHDWLTSYHPVVGTTGSVTGVSVVVQDVTDRARAEAALLTAHRRLQDILDRMFVFVGVFSTDGVLQAINQAPLDAAHLTRDDLVGRAFSDISIWAYSEPVRERLWAAIQQAAGGTMVRYDDRFLIKANHHIWLDVMLSPMRDAAGRVTEIVASGVDITERKQTSDALGVARERLQYLSRRLLEAQETERRSLAHELHDEIGQALTATQINLQAIERFPDPDMLSDRLRDSAAIVSRALDQVRSLSLALRPAMLDDLGLTAALRWLLDQLAGRAGLQTTFVSTLDGRRVDAAVETGCFRVAQEALNNIVKHAGARTAGVDLRATTHGLHLRVRDDGVGFEVADARARASRGASLGLLGMEERTALTGGSIEWISREGQGTEVHAWFPTTHPNR
jgi:PAS domain S-box-containing protein